MQMMMIYLRMNLMQQEMTILMKMMMIMDINKDRVDCRVEVFE